MTEEPKDDQTPAVVLQEPARDRPATDWREGFTLRPEETGVPGLHPGWAAVLVAGEVPLWQGRPVADLPSGVFEIWPVISVIAFFAVIVLQSDGDVGFLLFVAMGLAFLWFAQRKRGMRVGGDRLYLLTDRAAYLARDRPVALADVVCFPITPSMQVGLGPRSVTFASRRDANGKLEPEGFLDISDARQVHDLIRAVQKGKA